MLNKERIFVSTAKKYCDQRGISIDVKSQGWLLVMQRGDERRFALGYDLGLNSSVTQGIADDKAATAEVLEISGVPCVSHALFLSPKLSEYIPEKGSWEAMLLLLGKYPRGIVVKPNEGTGGNAVFKVLTRRDLEQAVGQIFSSARSLSISPFLEIEAEVRVVLLGDVALVVYEKNRPSVLGDGKHSLLELALATVPVEQQSVVLPGMIDDLDEAALGEVLPAGQRRVLNWRHNLGSGAEPALLEQGAMRDACTELATRAARAIGLRFGSVDVVQVEGAWRVLEINSGVMMEALSQQHPDLVYTTYSAALDRVFA
jgi:glutathione synthase/RimK-type ligase-like ATP-grasp enzyme